MNKLLVAAFITVATISQAQADQVRWPNWYVGLSGGVAFLENSDIKGSTNGKLDYKTGYMGTASLGYMPPVSFQPLSNMRFEAEAGFHRNALDSFGAAAANGSLHSLTYMGNAYYDFRNTSAWTPYVGGGAGGARVWLSRNSGLGNIDNTDTVLAYQFMGGIAYAPSSMPMTEWNLGYRYFAEKNPSFASASGKVKLDTPVANNVELGAKFRF